jgi:hypothetical protein
MPQSTLDEDGQNRLKVFIRLWRDENLRIDDALAKALEGVSEEARRFYLEDELKRRAQRSIRAQDKKLSNLLARLMNDPVVQAGARAHELQLTARIPEHDR